MFDPRCNLSAETNENHRGQDLEVVRKLPTLISQAPPESIEVSETKHYSAAEQFYETII